MRIVVHNSVEFPLVDFWSVQLHQVCCTTSLRFVTTLRRVSLCSLVLLSQGTFSHLQRCCFLCCYAVASGDASADPWLASDSSPSSDGCHPGLSPAKLSQIFARASVNHSSYASFDNLDPDSGLSMPRGLEDYPCSDLLNARMREQFYMDQYPDRINIENAYKDKKEYASEYYQKQKEAGTTFYDKNKEYCLAKCKEYVLKNAEKTKIYQAGWKKANPNSSRPKKECPHCHLLFNPGNISRHKKGCASSIPLV